MIRILSFTGLVLALTLLACGGDDQGPVKPDPATPFPYEVPTVATMQVDLTDLSGGKTESPPRVCHALSALAVTWVNANVAVRLAVPTAALSACLQQPVVYLGDDTWRWTATGGTPAWTAELTATKSGASAVGWSMRVSGTAQQLDRFLWFEGQSDHLAHTGYWDYYDPASAPAAVEALHCDWTLPVLPGEAKEVEFEVTREGSSQFGDILHYEVVSYMASVRYAEADPAGVTDIQWDLRTGAGAFRAPGDVCCWGPRPDFPDEDCTIP